MQIIKITTNKIQNYHLISSHTPTLLFRLLSGTIFTKFHPIVRHGFKDFVMPYDHVESFRYFDENSELYFDSTHQYSIGDVIPESEITGQYEKRLFLKFDNSANRTIDYGWTFNGDGIDHDISIDRIDDNLIKITFDGLSTLARTNDHNPHIAHDLQLERVYTTP